MDGRRRPGVGGRSRSHSHEADEYCRAAHHHGQATWTGAQPAPYPRPPHLLARLPHDPPPSLPRTPVGGERLRAQYRRRKGAGTATNSGVPTSPHGSGNRPAPRSPTNSLRVISTPIQPASTSGGITGRGIPSARNTPPSRGTWPSTDSISLRSRPTTSPSSRAPHPALTRPTSSMGTVIATASAWSRQAPTRRSPTARAWRPALGLRVPASSRGLVIVRPGPPAGTRVRRPSGSRCEPGRNGDGLLLEERVQPFRAEFAAHA
jgi:hypothetical protein